MIPSYTNQATFGGWLGPKSGDILSQIPALNAQYGAYKNAYSALQPAEDASLGSYDVQTGNVRNRALGSLNGRGLGRSLLGNRMGGDSAPTSGYGSGALANIASSRLTGRNAVEQGYTNQANSLTNDLMGTAYNAQNQFNSLDLEKQRLKQQQDAANDPLRFLSVIPQAAKFL